MAPHWALMEAKKQRRDDFRSIRGDIMQNNRDYTSELKEHIKELPAEDIRRWNLEIFEKYQEIAEKTINKLKTLKEEEEEKIERYREALKELDKAQAIISEMKDRQIQRKLEYLKHAEKDKEKEIIIKHFIELTHKNYMQMRLKTIRKALDEITDKEFTEYIRKNKDIKHIEKSRIDRIIIEVLDENTIVAGNLREELEKKKRDKNRKIISEELIEKIEEEIEEDIDEVLRKWKELKRKADEEGKEINGIKIREITIDNIKMKTMFYYAVPGKPIRLRIITNVQEAVKRELWNDEEIKEKYKLATWKKDTETNFILPEHLETYRRREQEITHKIKDAAIKLFRKECAEIGIKFTIPILYISIAEICYELPTSTHKEELEKFFFEKYRHYKPYAANFIKIKYEKRTERPHLYLDLIHLNPEDPTITFKIYPKFIHEGKIYIRREIVARKIMKVLGKNISINKNGVAYWLLDRPEMARKLLIKFLEFQMKEKEEFIKKQKAKERIDIYNLPALLKIEDRILINLITHGRLTSYVQTKVKNELIKRRVIEKKRHGVYEITPEFKKLLKKIMA